MDFLPKDELTPKEPKTPKNDDGPSKGRVTLWIAGAAVGLYMLGSGIIGLLTH